MVVVDDLDERLDLGAFLLSGLGHAAGDLAGVPLDASNDGMAVRVSLATVVDGGDDDDLKQLLVSISHILFLHAPPIHKKSWWFDAVVLVAATVPK